MENLIGKEYTCRDCGKRRIIAHAYPTDRDIVLLCKECYDALMDELTGQQFLEYRSDIEFPE